MDQHGESPTDTSDGAARPDVCAEDHPGHHAAFVAHPEGVNVEAARHR